MTKPYNPSELLEFVAQSPRGDDEDRLGPGAFEQSGEPPRVVVVGFKVPFGDLMVFILKVALAAIPIAAVAAGAVYAALKLLPRLL